MRLQTEKEAARINARISQDLTVINVLCFAKHLHRSAVTHGFQFYKVELFVIKQPLWMNPELHQRRQDIFKQLKVRDKPTTTYPLDPPQCLEISPSISFNINSISFKPHKPEDLKSETERE